MIFTKEKKAVDLVAEHVDVVSQCVKMAGGAVDAYIENNISEASDLALQADALDLDANNKMERIMGRLRQAGGLAPIRENLFLLASGLNRVADGAATCGLFFLDRRPEIPQPIRLTLKKFAVIAFGGHTELKIDALSCLKGGWHQGKSCDPAIKFGTTREEVRKIRRDLNHRISEDTKAPWRQLALDASLTQVAGVFDRMAIAADIITRINLKHGI
jgi:hypothetical protein